VDRVGVHEAKAKFSELLKRVQKGERIVITKNGVPVTVLSGFGSSADLEKAITMIRVFRRGHPELVSESHSLGIPQLQHPVFSHVPKHKKPKT